MYEAAQLWATVASQAMYLPCDHGTGVAPSVLLPFDVNWPRGSLVLGTPFFTRARHMMSLMAKWRCGRSWDFLHTSPRWPSEPTSAPQWQTWGPHRSSPNLMPTATLTASLSRARPHDAIGIAISQSAERRPAAASTLALLTRSFPLRRILVLPLSTTGRSHALCLVGHGTAGSGMDPLRSSMNSSQYSSGPDSTIERSADWRPRVAAAEAK